LNQKQRFEVEKREGQDLQELQELALHHSAKKHKSLAETRMIVKALTFVSLLTVRVCLVTFLWHGLVS